MKPVLNYAYINGPWQIGDIIVAIWGGMGGPTWDYKRGDIGVIIDWKARDGYHVKVGNKVYPGVSQHSWQIQTERGVV